MRRMFDERECRFAFATQRYRRAFLLEIWSRCFWCLAVSKEFRKAKQADRAHKLMNRWETHKMKTEKRDKERMYEPSDRENVSLLLVCLAFRIFLFPFFVFYFINKAIVLNALSSHSPTNPFYSKYVVIETLVCIATVQIRSILNA